MHTRPNTEDDAGITFHFDKYDDGRTNITLCLQDDDSKIIGHLLGHWGPTPIISPSLSDDFIDAEPTANVIAVLSKIEVGSPWRGQGFGSLIINKFINLCSENMVEEIYLCVAPSDETETSYLVSWYETRGFRRLNDNDEPTMMLRLISSQRIASSSPAAPSIR